MNADLLVVERFLGALSEMTVKGTVILAVAGIVTTWGMRRAAAATRHLVWSVAVAAVLALPLVGTIAPHWSTPALRWTPLGFSGGMSAATYAPLAAPVALAPLAPLAPLGSLAGELTRASGSAATGELQARIETLAADAQRLANAIAAPAVTTEATRERTPDSVVLPPLRETLGTLSPSNNSVASPTRDSYTATEGMTVLSRVRRSSPLAWLAAVWAAGALFILGRLLLGTFSLWRIGRRARPADDAAWLSLLQSLRHRLGIRRGVTLLVGGADAVPMTWGIVSPVVLLPPDATTWSDERRRAVLLHELAHVERLDMLTHLMSQLVLAALWFHPLAILASRRLRAERERACDDLVLSTGGVRATAYADDLLTLVRTLGHSRAMSAGLAMARKSDFEGRLLSILDPAAPRARTDRKRTTIAALMVAVAVIPLAGLRSAAASESHPILEPLVGPLSAGADDAVFRGEGLWSSRTAPAPGPAPVTTAAADTAMPKDRATAPARFDVRMSSSTYIVGRPVDISIPATSPRLDALHTLLPPNEQSAQEQRAQEQRPQEAPSQERAPQDALPAEVIADLARAVSGMSSDNDKAAVLLKLAPRAGENAAIRSAFFGSVKSMANCSDKRRVLLPVVARFGDDSTLGYALEIANGMTTESERAAVLVAIAGKRRLSEPMVRDRFFRALDGITSEGSRASVLFAAIDAERENTAVHRAALASAGRITSESTRANVLLALATSTNALRDPDTRARFIDTLGRITSSSQYRRVMDAVVR